MTQAAHGGKSEMRSKRISKAEHVERMGARASRRAQDALGVKTDYRDLAAMEKVREARRKNGVGRPPRKSQHAQSGTASKDLSPSVTA